MYGLEDSLVVQWLELSALLLRARVQSLFRKPRSHKTHDATKIKIKIKKHTHIQA